MYDLSKVDFIPAPEGFSDYKNEQVWLGHVDNEENQGVGANGELILGYDHDNESAYLAYSDGRRWFSSVDSDDWPVLNAKFGRGNWQNLVRETEQDHQ